MSRPPLLGEEGKSPDSEFGYCVDCHSDNRFDTASFVFANCANVSCVIACRSSTEAPVNTRFARFSRERRSACIYRGETSEAGIREGTNHGSFQKNSVPDRF